MNVIKRTSYFNIAQENRINEFEKNLIGLCEIEGKHTGQLNKPESEPEFRAFIMNQVEAKTQSEIDRNHEYNTPVSGMVIAKAQQSDAKEKINPLNASLTEDEHKLRPLEEKKKQCSPDLKKRLLRRWVYIGLALISITEGFFAFEAFRAALIPRIAAFCSATGIAVAVGLGSHFLAAYIQKAKTRMQRIFRYSVVLVPAFIGFYILGNLRSEAYNKAAHLNFQINENSVASDGSVSGLSITIISFLLFLTALLFSIHVCKTEEERIEDKEYDKVCDEIKKLQSKTRLTKNTITTIQSQFLEKSSEALVRYEYSLAYENRLIAIAKNAIEAFKCTNLRYRTDGLCPEFFSNPPAFRFKLFFDNLKTNQNEKDTSSRVA